MKKSLFAFILFFILLVSCSAPEQTVPPESTGSDFYTFTSSDGMISFTYPEDWTLNFKNAGASAELVAPNGENDGFFENLIITYSALPPTITSLEAYIQNVYSELLDKIQSFALVSRESVTVSEQAAVALTFEGSPAQASTDGERYRWLQVYTVRNGTVFVFSYTAKADSSALLLTKAKDIIASVVLFPEGK